MTTNVEENSKAITACIVGVDAMRALYRALAEVGGVSAAYDGANGMLKAYATGLLTAWPGLQLSGFFDPEPFKNPLVRGRFFQPYAQFLAMVAEGFEVVPELTGGDRRARKFAAVVRECKRASMLMSLHVAGIETGRNHLAFYQVELGGFNK